MRMLENGELQTLNGYAVLDVGRAPITLDPTAGAPKIARDGMITPGRRSSSARSVSSASIRGPSLTASRIPPSFRPPGPSRSSTSHGGVVQGFVEESNVNPVMEISRLIMVPAPSNGIGADRATPIRRARRRSGRSGKPYAS